MQFWSYNRFWSYNNILDVGVKEQHFSIFQVKQTVLRSTAKTKGYLFAFFNKLIINFFFYAA